MKHFVRLIARDYWGTFRAPLTYDITSHKYFQAAKKSGGMKNLQLLRGLDAATEEVQNDAGAAFCLRSRLVWPSEWNQRTVWMPLLSAAHLVQLPNPFGKKKPGLSHDAYEKGVSYPYRSTFKIGADQSFAIRAFLFETPKTDSEESEDLPETRNIWTAGWGKWQFRIVDGSFELQRKTTLWTQALQDELDTLHNVEAPTIEQQERIDNLTGPRCVQAGGHVDFPEAIFDIVESLSLGSPIKEDEGAFYELSFIPEPRGRLNITLSGSKPQSIEIPELLDAKQPGHVWEESLLTIQTNGAAHIWQTGKFAFAAPGSLRIGPFKTGTFTDAIETALLLWLGDKSLPGTNITIERIDINSVYFAFRVTLTTANSAYTPFLYGAQANLAARARGGGVAAAWDSDEHKDAAGNPPILELTPSFEGVMKRRSWGVTLRDPKGEVLSGIERDFWCEALENRIVDLKCNGANLLTTGLVKSAQLGDTNAARYTPPSGEIQASRIWIAKAKTRIDLTIVDGWGLLDEDLMQDAPIGDGMLLGKYLRLVFKAGGWTDAQLAGISENAGDELPKARLGEAPCVRPEPGQSRGEFVRSLVEQYGLGWILWIDSNGVWQFGPRSTTVKQIGGQNVAFSSDPARNSNTTFPGRFAVLSPLDHLRDFENFYNYFRVEGAIDPKTGVRFADDWAVQESLKRGFGRQSPNFIGRLKPYPTVRNEGLRDADAVQRVLRSLVLLYGRSGRFLQFETYFHAELMPSDIVLVDGLKCEVARVSGSLASDRMTLVVLELE